MTIIDILQKAVDEGASDAFIVAFALLFAAEIAAIIPIAAIRTSEALSIFSGVKS